MNKPVSHILLGAILLLGMIFSFILYIDEQFKIKPTVIIEELEDPGQTKQPPQATPGGEGKILAALYNSGYLYHEGIDEGINKDVLEELARRMGMNLELHVMPRARIDNMLKEGTLHMSVSAVETPERARYAWYVPYFAQKNDVLIRSEAGIINEEGLLHRRDIRVGIIRGYYYGEHYMALIEKLKAKNRVVEAKDTEALYQMLKENWIQVTFNIASSYRYYFKTMDIENISALDWAPGEAPLIRCLSLSKKYFDQEDVERFTRIINEMRNDGTLHKIFLRYLSEEEAQRMCDF